MILTIGPGGCGFSFLNWSIAFLRGDTTYTKLDGTIIPILDNPLLGKTAHNNIKDHLSPQLDRKILNQSTNQSIIYVVPEDHTDFMSILEQPGKKIIFDNTRYCQEQITRHYTTVPNSPFVKLITDLSVLHNVDDVKNCILEVANIFIYSIGLPLFLTFLIETFEIILSIFSFY